MLPSTRCGVLQAIRSRKHQHQHCQYLQRAPQLPTHTHWVSAHQTRSPQSSNPAQENTNLTYTQCPTKSLSCPQHTRCSPHIRASQKGTRDLARQMDPQTVPPQKLIEADALKHCKRCRADLGHWPCEFTVCFHFPSFSIIPI